MSVYNFNDNEHVAVNNHETGQSNGNGMQPSSYQHMDNDFLNRSLNQTPNHGESSVQLTRPTSKTALLVRQRRAMLEQLSCFICKGYLIDATTIDECMDSFCKSCIVVYLKNNNDCPKCGAIIQHHSPFDAIRPDKVLQEIVYKMIPGLFDDEMKRRREFYKEHYGAISSSSEEDDDSSTGSLTIQGSSLIGERYGVITHPKPFYKPSDSIDLSIEPQTRGENSTIYFDNRRQSIVTSFTGISPRDCHDDDTTFSTVDSQLFKTYLRCPARLNVLQLKKFIAAKFNICRDNTIHLKYLNESLRDEYSLIDIAYIYDWRGLEHMQLFYIIERDLSRATITNGHQTDSHRRAGKATRQNAGTSTQTVKRVCIDPQPKFYDEKNNNNVDLMNAEGRSMRLRLDNPTSVSKTTQVTQTNPIIKVSRSDTGRLATEEVGHNGVSTREQASKQNRIFSTRQPAQEKMTIDGTGIKEPRSLRSQVTGATRTSAITTSIPKMNITETQSGRSSNQVSASNVDLNDADIPQNKTMSQIVPYSGARFTTVASTTQSSLVTMESFVEARSNHVITTLNSNASASTTYANNTRTLPNEAIKAGQAPRYDSTPQLAFRFVTERGITIVRRLNNQESSPSPLGISDVSSTRQRDASGSSTVQTNSPSPTRHPANHGQIQPSSSRTTSDDGMSSRHQIKVKPVYRTLVDPSKLKSPNLKKFGFAARH